MTGLVLERLLPEGAAAPTTANGVLRASSVGALRKSSRERRDWRGWARDVAVEHMWQAITAPVDVEVVQLRPNRIGWPDVGAAFFLAKAMLDGLVDAGVLRDDSPEHVRSLCFREPQLGARHGVRITLTVAEQHSPPTPAGGFLLPVPTP